MLQEVALTPTAFSVACQSDHGRLLHELKNLLLPYSCDSPLIISNLNNGGWIDAIKEVIGRIPDTSLRNEAQDLLRQLDDQKMLVPRGCEVSTKLWDESECIKEIVASSERFPIASTITSCRLGNLPSVAIRDLRSGFKKSDLCSNPRHVPRSVVHQESMLKFLARYSDWLLIRFPYVRGSDDDEIVTVKQLMSLSLRSLDGSCNRQRSFEIQLSPNQVKTHTVDNVLKELHDFDKRDLRIQVTVSCESFTNREILFGSLVPSGSKQIKDARWLLSMQHVAIRRDNTGEPNQWTFHGHVMASRRYEEIRKIDIRLEM